MNIIIAGAGKVGFELARSLSSQHDVVIIDKNSEALERLQEIIDIFPVVGDIENPETYKTLLNMKADIFIAVTDSDEANILSTLLVNDSVKVDRKIIRLKNSYFSQSSFLSSLGDVELVFPFQLAAQTIRLLLAHPEANNVKTFANTNSKLISIKVDNPDHEEKLVGLFENDQVKIVAIERDKKFMIPNKMDTIVHDDLVYFFGDSKVLEHLYGELDLHMPKNISTVVIFGAKTLGIEIAKVLIEEGIKVKIVEKDIEYCSRASEALQDKALIINSHYDENILYAEESLSSADMIITTGSQDEQNIVRAIQAQEHDIPKVVAINNEKKYYSLMHQLGIVAARGPRTSAYYAILESLSAYATIEAKHFCGGAGIILNRNIQPLCSLIGLDVYPRADEDGILLINRDKENIVIEEKITLKENDTLFLVVSAKDEKRGKEWISSL